MTLSERCNYLSMIFDDLQDTSSTLEKRFIVSQVPEELKEDFQYCVACLNGLHKFGYSYPYFMKDVYGLLGDHRNESNTVKEVLEFLQEPRMNGDLSNRNIKRYVDQTAYLGWFFGPIVNRTLKLGIGNSILPKSGLAPMLAKKFEDKLTFDKNGYFITEKLDGNRCIATYENHKWVFRSRNGKLMHVDFNVGNLPTDLVYDGEVMSRSQTLSSMKLHVNLIYGTENNPVYKDEFSATSGMINRHSGKKDLVYNIFDIMIDDVPYYERREELNKIAENLETMDVRIVPSIARSSFTDIDSTASEYLSRVCNMGGEGLMINLASGTYDHKRTNQLLKLKQVQSIDMVVTSIQEGTGKYEYMVGAINCMCNTDDGKCIEVSVGSGLSDEQRSNWMLHPENIIGKIVEVQYFSMSQDSKKRDTNYYSLRFPRLKKVREDKNTTSQY